MNLRGVFYKLNMKTHFGYFIVEILCAWQIYSNSWCDSQIISGGQTLHRSSCPYYISIP